MAVVVVVAVEDCKGSLKDAADDGDIDKTESKDSG